MQLTEAQTKALLLFGEQLQLKHQGLSLLVTRLREIYKNNPSPETLFLCTGELNSFIHKFEILLTYDLTQINSLKEI